jgi:1-acyl-sn-glycerol-3-phosphate acyltransferase
MEIVELVHKVNITSVTRLWLYFLRSYFRVEVVGLENIPRKGPALIIPNHSGFAGADAVLLTYVIKRATRRRARLMAHRAFFDFSKTLKTVSESFGLRKAGISSGVSVLKKGQLLILFPEGETGNFKPTTHRYELQPFHTGFLRMAIETGAPIIPCFVIGAEESHLNLGNINFSKLIKGLRMPLPVNFIPLPAKWKIVLLPPIDTQQYSRELLEDKKGLQRLAVRFQKQLQKAILQELKNRPFIYFRATRKLMNGVEGTYKKLLYGKPETAKRRGAKTPVRKLRKLAP